MDHLSELSAPGVGGVQRHFFSPKISVNKKSKQQLLLIVIIIY